VVWGVQPEVADLLGRQEFVFGHLHGAVERFEEPLPAAGERAKVPRAREQRVDERVLPGDDFHEPPVVHHARRGEPVVSVEERHPDRLLVVAVGHLPGDGLQGVPRDGTSDEPANAHSGETRRSDKCPAAV